MSRIAGIRAAMGGLKAVGRGIDAVAVPATGALMAGSFLAGPVGGVVDDLLHGGERQEGAIRATEASMQQQWAERLKAERVQRDMAASLQNLARLNPQMYASMLAGRPLPDEAIWIGGQPGRDMVDDVAYGMATGRYAPPPSMSQQYTQQAI